MDTIAYAKSSSAYKLAKQVETGLTNKVSLGGSSIVVPVGTTATRPTLGMGESAIRYNSDVGGLEEWTGVEWKNMSADISAITLKGTDTEVNILAKVGMVAEDLWIASDTLDGWVYDGLVWINIGPLQGPQGLQGIAGKSAYTVAVEGGFVGTEAQWLLSLVGDTGATGNGIASIVKTGTVGLVDTYTVTMTSGATDTFTVTNGLDGVDGLDVDHIAQTSGTGAAGTVDVYTVWGDVAETISLGTFNVYNGSNGTDGLGVGDMVKTTYDTNDSGVVDNAEKVNGLTVETAVPIGAVFTDTVTPLNNTLTSISTIEALTANQGKVLKDLVDTKQATLSSGTNIKTINSSSILGSGNISTVDSTKLPLTGGNLTGAVNIARATVASHATTADIWTALGNQIDWTGTATTTAFPNSPQAGAERTLICAGACSFTAGANMLIDGVASGATVTCATNDTVIVRAVSTTQFKLSRIKYDGTAQVSAAGGSIVGIVLLTSGASYSVPSNVTRIKATCVGGGGGCWNNNGIKAGGAGGVAQSVFTVTPGSSITYSIGAAGTVGATPTSGGTTTFNTSCSGGGGGTGGSGGSSSGNITYPNFGASRYIYAGGTFVGIESGSPALGLGACGIVSSTGGPGTNKSGLGFGVGGVSDATTSFNALPGAIYLELYA